MNDEIEIIVPKGPDLGGVVAHGLVALTEAIAHHDPNIVAHGCFGGEFGYGARYENDVFVMRPFYWGDCDCGAEGRSESWFADNPHADDCWQAERDRRWNAYDEKVGWQAIEDAAFPKGGGFIERMNMVAEATDVPGLTVMVSRPRTDAAMKAWRRSSDARDRAHAKIVRETYIAFGMKPEPYQWFCSCGRDDRAKTADIGHRDNCSVVLPNFKHKRSGVEIRWYKYIGRDTEIKADGRVDW